MIDGTVGMGGHAEALLMTSPASVRLLGLDVDPEAVRRAGLRLARFGDRVRLARASFANLGSAAEAHGVGRAHAILLDLGVSSHQLETSGRGFSFQRDEPLDMRLDPERGETAADLVNRRPEVELVRILVEYGEERHARRIARAIVRRRPLRTTGDLVAAVRSAVPRAAWPRRLHVATRTFQAVRMAVNDEPAALRAALHAAPALLDVGGRLGVIAFHSGEDRVVKQTFRALESAGFAELEPSPLGPESPRPERQAARAGAALVTGPQRLHREPDPRTRRILVAALTAAALLVGGALTVVGMRVQQVQLAYRLDEARAQQARAQGNVRQLEIEVATLRSPARVEARARRLGLSPPGRDQMRLAHEYVAGGTRLAATRWGRIEALAK